MEKERERERGEKCFSVVVKLRFSQNVVLYYYCYYHAYAYAPPPLKSVLYLLDLGSND